MNGKLARALRHGHAKTATQKDLAILMRQLEKAKIRAEYQPKPLVVRKRLQSGAHGSHGYSKFQLAHPPVLVVTKPVRRLKIRLHEHSNTLSNFTGVGCWRDLVWRPKHILDTFALRA